MAEHLILTLDDKLYRFCHFMPTPPNECLSFKVYLHKISRRTNFNISFDEFSAKLKKMET